MQSQKNASNAIYNNNNKDIYVSLCTVMIHYALVVMINGNCRIFPVRFSYWFLQRSYNKLYHSLVWIIIFPISFCYMFFGQCSHLIPLETWFSGVFNGYQMGTLSRNGFGLPQNIITWRICLISRTLNPYHSHESLENCLFLYTLILYSRLTF